MGPRAMGSNTPDSSSSGRFIPLMMAAKLLMSLVTNAVAVEKAAISVARAHSRTTRTKRPAQCTVNPKPTAIATTTASKTVIINRPDRIGPIRMANRLAGVTRSRSMSPDWSSKIVSNPAPAPDANASRARMPGRNSSQHAAGRETLDPGQAFQQGGEEQQVEHGCREPDEQPDRVAQQLQV